MGEVDERLRILRMVESRQVTVEEALRLLQALDRGSAETQQETARSARWLRVRVTDASTGRDKVNVSIPIGLVSVGMRLGARFAPGMTPAEMERFLQAVRDGTPGQIMNVEDHSADERVEVCIE